MSSLALAIRFYAYAACALAGLSLLLDPLLAMRTSDTRLPTLKVESPVGTIQAAISKNRDGPAIIYVHGTPGQAGDWESYITRPIEDTRSIALDRPGFAGSAGTGALPSLRAQARALEPFLRECQGRKPVLVGHSMGGQIVVQAAVDYPDRVAGIVIIAGHLDPDISAWRWYNQLADQPLVRLVLPSFIRNSNLEMKSMNEELLQLSKRLDELACPVLIIHDRQDRLVPVANVDFMLHRFPAEIITASEISDGKDHFLIWNDEARMRRLIGEFAHHCWDHSLQSPAGGAQQQPDEERAAKAGGNDAHR